MSRPEPFVLLADWRGIYLPRDFATGFRRDVFDGIAGSDPEWKVLESGPAHPDYWEVWADVLDHVTLVEHRGTPRETRYRLEQDGDLRAIPEGMEWDDTTATYYWP